ncbi:MAG: V-type ATPase subunit, partial [Clostridia bacterium]|nr:V-type ATPase subunit [Clostridia bacterium]
TKFGKALEKLDYVYKGEIDNIGLYKTTLKNMYFSTYPLVVMLSYVFVMQTEYNNIVSIIEGVRYNVDPSKIKTLIIT